MGHLKGGGYLPNTNSVDRFFGLLFLDKFVKSNTF